MTSSAAHAEDFGTSRRQSSLDFQFSVNWTNETFANALCGNLTAGNYPTGILFVPQGGPTTNYYLLPDCFYLYPAIGYISLQYVVLRGGSGGSHSDPLARLAEGRATTMSTLHIEDFHLVDFSNTSTTINWSNFFSSTDVLSLLTLRNSRTSIGNISSMILPSHLYDVKIDNCQLRGSFHTSLFSSSTSPTLHFAVPNNQLSGSLPSGLFGSASPVYDFLFSITNNQITDTIPSDMFPANFFATTAFFRMELTNNLLSGDLANLFNGSPFGSDQLITYHFAAGSNQLTGDIPLWHADKCSKLQMFHFNASNNALSGTFPSTFFPASKFSSELSTIIVLVSNNRLTGSLYNNLFDLRDSIAAITLSIPTISVDLQDNLLSGALPPLLFSSLNWTSTQTAQFNFARNRFTQDLPTTIFRAGSSTAWLREFKLSFEGNRALNGTVPATFLESLITSDISAQNITGSINCANTGLTGQLRLPNSGLRSQFLFLDLDTSNSNFTSLSMSEHAVIGLKSLDLSHNPHLAGTVPDSFFSTISNIERLRFTNTSISGDMPRLDLLPAPRLTELQLSSTNIDFCGLNRGAWNHPINTCYLLRTSAGGCPELWPSCSSSHPPSPTPPPTNPLAPPLSPVSPQCAAATRPSPDFICDNGVWKFTGSINTPTFLIPSGSTETIVVGNVTSPNIIINGFGSTLVIQQGCASNLSSIIVQLTKDDLKKIGKTKSQLLLSIDGNNSTCSFDDLFNVTVSLKLSDGTSCRKAKVSKVQSNGQISALFNVDQSACRTWWIILVSVVAAIVVLAVTVLVLLVIFVPSVRYFVRPYSKRNAKKTSAELT